MIIPVRCMNCGFLLGDKWRYYEKEVARLRTEKGLGKEPMYIDGSNVPITPEREVCDKLGITRYCCRKTMLTHRDIIEKI